MFYSLAKVVLDADSTKKEPSKIWDFTALAFYANQNRNLVLRDTCRFGEKVPKQFGKFET